MKFRLVNILAIEVHFADVSVSAGTREQVNILPHMHRSAPRGSYDDDDTIIVRHCIGHNVVY